MKTFIVGLGLGLGTILGPFSFSLFHVHDNRAGKLNVV